MVRQVAETISKYGMVHAGERVGVAVSSGPDSVALLRVLCELQAELGILLGVVHVNHLLRGEESEGDAQFTRTLAESLGLDFLMQTADVRAQAAEGHENLEQAARRVRYEFFHRLIEQGQFQKIAVGHTRTDQAETVLFRFLRGAATAGLAGIYPVTDRGIVRPLIEIERGDVLEYLRAGGRAWREDSSNHNLSLSRNRLRHALLPQLEREWNPNLTRVLAQLADWARDEEQYWRVEAARLAEQYLRIKDRLVCLEASAVSSLPAAAERRLLRRAVELVRGHLREIEFTHIEQIRLLTAMEEGHGRLQIPGVDVFRSFDLVRLAPVEDREGLETRNFSLVLAIPGTYEVPQTGSRFIFKLRGTDRSDREYNDKWACLDWERTPRPLYLRNWRPGDHYQPVGRGSAEKLKTLFQHRKVPLWERRRWPVVASESAVIWARGFGPAADLLPGPHSQTVLEIEEV